MSLHLSALRSAEFVEDIELERNVACAAGFHGVIPLGKPATAFLFELIARLKELATCR